MGFSAPYLIVMNKCDGIGSRMGYPKDCIFISAKDEIGIEELKSEILKKFQDSYLFREIFVSYEQMNEYQKVRERLKENNVAFTDEGMRVQAVIPSDYYPLFRKFITSE